MSNISDILFSAQDGKLVDNLADRFGLTPEQMESAIDALMPALAIGLRNASDNPDALGKVIGAVTTPQHLGAFDNPELAHSDDNLEQSRDVLAQLFGSSAATGQVLQVAARESGLRPDVLGQLLPVLISVVLGGISKSLNNQGLGGILGQLVNSGSLGPLLEQILGGGGVPGGGAPPRPAPQGGGGLGGPGGGAGGGLGGAGGGLGGLLGGLLGSLLRGGRRPQPAPGGFDRAPADAGRETSPTGGPAGLPAGLDPADLQAAIEQIKKTLQPGAGSKQGQHAELEDIIGQVFGRRGG